MNHSKSILVRADASRKIGTGHVMRCLTLANEASKRGWRVCFVLRDPNQEIVKLIKLMHHDVKILTSKNSCKSYGTLTSMYDHWLNVRQDVDAEETFAATGDFKPEWIVIDHYSLDQTWHKIAKQYGNKIMVIDDLGNRNLDCDLLLDQNLVSGREKYNGKVPRNCRVLLGPSFALLRTEFREWREHSMKRRLNRVVEKVLITMGGVDSENFTLQVLLELTKSKYAKNCVFTVIIGGTYPHTHALYKFVETSSLTVSVLSNVTNMAEIMSKSDLCIGAAGSTSWERCCLALPTITLAIADNQIEIAEQLSQNKVGIYSDLGNLIIDFERFFDVSGKELQRSLSINSSQICDGLGVLRVLAELEKKFEN